MEQNTEKVKALAEYIIEECKKQDFTVFEFECLVRELEAVYTRRQTETYKELF